MKYKVLSDSELIDGGLLQEINRLFLHARGVSLALLPEDGLKIISYRPAPAGLRFDIAEDDVGVMNEKQAMVADLKNVRAPLRKERLGAATQPIKVTLKE